LNRIEGTASASMSCVITPAVAAGKMGAFDALGGPFVQFCVVLMKAFPPAPVQEVTFGAASAADETSRWRG
jgi:hypothetical protein